jgi:hypothetical protein
MSDPSPKKSGKGAWLFLSGVALAAAAWALFLWEPKTCTACGGVGKFIPLCKPCGSDGKISWFDFIRRRLAD